MSIKEKSLWPQASFRVDHNFKKTKNDHCVFIKRYACDNFLILLLYIDNMLIVGQDRNKIAALKQDLGKCSAMKDLGQKRQILGIKITQDRSKKLLWLSQKSMLKECWKDSTYTKESR